MANRLLSITLVMILFWCSTLATRTKLLPLNTITALAPKLSDGVCSSLVKTQNYACEEHLVGTVHYFNLFLFCVLIKKSATFRTRSRF